MAVSFLEYPLQDGYIHNWLVAGPQAVPVPDLASSGPDDPRLAIARQHHRRISVVNEPPVEWDTLHVGDAKLTWNYRRCAMDHFVDLSVFHPAPHYLCAWAYCQLAVPSAQEVTWTLTTNGPADVWLNRQHVHRQEHFAPQEPRGLSFQAQLQEGTNEVLVRFEQVAIRECPYVMALHVAGLPSDGASVQLPIAHENASMRQTLERVYSEAYLKQTAVVSGEGVAFCWADQLDDSAEVMFLLQDKQDHVFSSGSSETKPGECMQLGHRQAGPEEGPYHLTLMPPSYIIQRFGMRYNESLPVYVFENAYSDAYYGTYEDRQKEALAYAAKQENDLYAEIAKFALGRGFSTDVDVFEEAVRRVNARHDGSDLDLVGLLGLLYRHGTSYALSGPLKRSLEECILGFRYWHDEPGSDAMCFATESHSILFHTCEVLAGQRYPDDTFLNANETGQWHRQKGERLAIDWLRQRGAIGFEEWDSNCSFEQDLVALSHLADLAEDVELREMAAVLMDKVLLTIALNSFKGAFGSTHGRTYASMVKGAHLEPTSGITRLLWGMGVWNEHIRGPVSLACSGYEMPSFIAAIATDLSQEFWGREQHQGVNKATYRTADYMLSSVQDYRPGEKGDQQHVWQATLGPEAVAFVTHPSLMSEEDSHRPNFWAGNAILPRVAQWKDTLIAVHQLPGEDRLGFTHAYLPVHSFDEHVLRDGWAFAREGTGYLALWAARGLELVERGPSAYRELRSYGQENVWVCRMGREAADGSFGDFQEAVLGLDLEVHGLAVTCHTLRGEALAFGWQGPLRVDGQEQALSGFRHYDSPNAAADYPASQIDVQFRDYTMRLLVGP
jgi:hypothetical protein